MTENSDLPAQAQRMKRFLNFQQVQEKLGNRSRTSLYRDIQVGRVPPPRKIGARLYWMEEDLDAWFEQP